MKPVAIVVQRCHESIVGGSESLAWQYATLLSENYEVELLTTTALDPASWNNALNVGSERNHGVLIRRFAVTLGRGDYWRLLYTRYMVQLENAQTYRNSNLNNLGWTTALQEEFIRHQGPYSQAMLNHLEQHAHNYRAVIFVTYLYPTSYFGIQAAPGIPKFLVPTLHDESIAYLPIFGVMAAQAQKLFWNTEAEKALSNRLWGDLPGRIISMGVDTSLHPPSTQFNRPYILYSGRITPGKGCDYLMEYFIKFKSTFPSNLVLVLTGHAEMEIPSHPDIVALGTVPDQEKFSLMSGALCFVMPSQYESLNIAMLEAMGQKTPALVYTKCQVTVDHVTKSGGGKVFSDYESFSSQLSTLQNNHEELSLMGGLARAYVVENYSLDKVARMLKEEIEAT